MSNRTDCMKSVKIRRCINYPLKTELCIAKIDKMILKAVQSSCYPFVLTTRSKLKHSIEIIISVYMFQNKIIALQNNDNHVFWMSLINKTRIHLSKSYGLKFALFVVTIYRVIFATYTINNICPFYSCKQFGPVLNLPRHSCALREIV